MNPNSVYDKDDSEPVTGPNLKALENQGDNTAPKEDNKDGGFYRPEEGKGKGESGNDNTSGTKDKLKGAESNTAGALASVAINPRKYGATQVKNLVVGTATNKKAWVGGGVIGSIIGAGILVFIVISGPGQLVQLAEILKNDFGGIKNSSSSRADKLFRYADSNDIGETRLGYLKTRYLRSTVDQLKNVGVEFNTNSNGVLNAATIDTDKLEARYPELAGMSEQDKINFLADTFKLAPDQISASSDTQFNIDASDFSLNSVSALSSNSLAALDDGSIITGLKSRVLSDYFGLPSLFHPFSRALEGKFNSLVNSADRKSAVEDEEDTNIEPAEAQADGAKSDVSSSPFSSGVVKTLTLTAGVCFVYSSANDIVKINEYRIMLPAAIEALSLISAGDQIKSGDDVSLSQVGATTDSLTDSSGNSVWQSKALQATEGDSNPTGPDLPDTYKEAFSGDGTVNDIQEGSNTVVHKLTGGFLGAGTVCSTPAQVAQIIGGVALGGANVLGEVVSDGTLTPAEIAELGAIYTLKEAAYVGENGLMFNFLQNFVLSHATDAKLAKDAFSGPLGGNLIAYGAKSAANMAAIADGGIQLTSGAVSAVAYQDQQQELQQFHSESLYARLFNIDDNRSLAGHFADDFSPDLVANLRNGLVGFENIGSNLFSGLGSLFSGHSSADSSYLWSIPQYGIPDSLLNNPTFNNPYENGDAVAKLLDAQCLNSDGSTNTGCNYISKASTCFGVNISKDSGMWDITPQIGNTPSLNVDVNSPQYQGADCNDLSDQNWQRIIMFVLDTRTMQAIACYQGDDQSCTEVGYSSQGSGTNSSASTSSTPSPSSSLSAYENPLRDVKGLFSRRIDQGVDYGGSGPIYAIGTGMVDKVYNYGQSSGWPGPSCPSDGCGGWVSYTLTDGPAAGDIVYFAESCNPTVHQGDIVGPNTVICQMNGDNDPWIETGWASGNGTTSKAVACWDNVSSAWGANFSKLLQKLGAPPGIPQEPNPPCTLPSNWPTWD